MGYTMSRTKIALTVLIVFVAVSVIPIALAIVGFATPSQFGKTYYGELAFMYRRLKEADGKKIVLVGNSATAFGVRSDLMEDEFDGYKVINFGLYGAIGTKAMMDLSKVNIGQGDIVVLLPEQNKQSLSLNFSATDFWYAADSDFSMIGCLDKENKRTLAGKYTDYVSAKYSYLTSDDAPSANGVYMQQSFNIGDDEVGYMTYARSNNIMPGGYDANNLIDFSIANIGNGFCEYLNEYNRFVRSRGATLYYGFAPVNKLSLNASANEVEEFRNYLCEVLDFPILGYPENYFLDGEWFYDSNVHLNSAGMLLYTRLLTEDLKLMSNISEPTKIEIPPKPSFPQDGGKIDGENVDEAAFLYDETETEVTIVGLSEIGKNKTSLQIPCSHNGKPVTSFDKNTFANNTTIRTIIVQKNIRIIADKSFEGCSKLTALNILQDNPNSLYVGVSLLSGADNCSIFVPSAALEIFETHYNWGMYRERMKKLAD